MESACNLVQKISMQHALGINRSHTNDPAIKFQKHLSFKNLKNFWRFYQKFMLQRYPQLTQRKKTQKPDSLKLFVGIIQLLTDFEMFWKFHKNFFEN